jgi:cell division protein FtsL
VRDERAAAGLLGRAIDNSQVVRELDPRSGRELWLLLLLVSGLVGGLVLYAWPTLELRRAGAARAEMARERERLLEENRKLRLEKAVLENLPRVETIAVRDLHLRTPSPGEVVVVEPPPAPPRAGVVASGAEPGRARN